VWTQIDTNVGLGLKGEIQWVLLEMYGASLRFLIFSDAQDLDRFSQTKHYTVPVPYVPYEHSYKNS
jgi:hypothetical protein